MFENRNQRSREDTTWAFINIPVYYNWQEFICTGEEKHTSEVEVNGMS